MPIPSIAEQDAGAIYLGNLATVDTDLALPTTGRQGSSISWASDDERWLKPDGTVVRPPFGRGDRRVKLTATVHHQSATATRTFMAHVLQLPCPAQPTTALPLHLQSRTGERFRLPLWTAAHTDHGDLAVPIIWPHGTEHHAPDSPCTLDVTGQTDTVPAVPVHAKLTVSDETTDTTDAGLRAAPDRVAHPVIPSWCPLPLSSVRLQPTSSFGKAQSLRHDYLMSLNIDQLLYAFRQASGLPTRDSQPMSGWDGPDCLLRGHTTGHVLSAMALDYAATGNADIIVKLNQLVDGLNEVQQAWERHPGIHRGFLSAYDESQFDELEQLTPYPQIWAPYYTLHKLLAGLIDAYQLAGNDQALALAEGVGSWTANRLERLDGTQLQRMWGIYIAGEFGGINDSLAVLSDIERSLGHTDAASRLLHATQLFDNDRLLVPLEQGVDALDGMHANQHIPQAIGYVRLYEQTGEQRYLDAAKRFWHEAAHGHCYGFGGVGNGEMFHAVDAIASQLGEETAESCATYNMVKLAKALQPYDADPTLMDYVQLATGNHLIASLSSQADGGCTYFMPTTPGSRRVFDITENTCCHGTGLETPFRFGEGLCFTDQTQRILRIMQYLPVLVNDADSGTDLTINVQESDPERISIQIHHLRHDTLRLHVPDWVCGQPTIAIDEIPVTPDYDPATHELILDHRMLEQAGRSSWSGATIEMNFPAKLAFRAAPDNPHVGELFWGPYVLAAMHDPKTPAAEATSSNGDSLAERFLVFDFDEQDLGGAFRRDAHHLEWTHTPTGIRFRPMSMLAPDQPMHLYIRRSSD